MDSFGQCLVNVLIRQSARKTFLQILPLKCFNGRIRLCVKRAALGRDYLRKTECPSGYKECYSGGCFVGDCPVTKIKLESRSKLSHDNQDKNLVTRKTPGELPLINIQMTFGNIPCFIQDLFAQTIKNSTYGLTAIREENCDKYGLDTHSSTILAFQTAENSFKKNSFPYPVMHLPYFDARSISTMSVLSSKVRIKTGKHDYCQEINNKSINEYFEAEVIPVVVCYMGFICLLLPRILCICEILSRRTKRWTPELFENLADLMKMFYQVNFWTSIVVIILVVSFKGLYPVFQTAKDYFEEYERLGCFIGGQGSMVVNDYLENFRGIERSFWIYWVFFVSSFLSGGACFWLYIVKNKLSRYSLTL